MKQCAIALLLAIALLAPAPAAAQAETAEQHYALGWKAFEAKDYETARRELDRAVKLRKEYAEAYLGLALVAWAEDKPHDASKQIDRALKYRPDYAEAHFIRGRLFYVRNDVKRARAEAEIALKLNPNLYAVHALLADLEIAAGKFDAALASFDRARRIAAADFDSVARLRERYEAVKGYVEYKKLWKAAPPGFVAPKILVYPEAEYTDAARGRGVSGDVLLLVRINARGDVDRAVVMTGLPDGLTASAVRAARAIKATPATLDGTPIDMWTRVVVKFRFR
jgi:TonB family protein